MEVVLRDSQRVTALASGRAGKADVLGMAVSAQHRRLGEELGDCLIASNRDGRLIEARTGKQHFYAVTDVPVSKTGMGYQSIGGSNPSLSAL